MGSYLETGSTWLYIEHESNNRVLLLLSSGFDKTYVYDVYITLLPNWVTQALRRGQYGHKDKHQ